MTDYFEVIHPLELRDADGDEVNASLLRKWSDQGDGSHSPASSGSSSAVQMNSADTATAAADTAVAITYAATASVAHKFRKLVWSYSEDPTGGALTITDGGTTVFQINITAGGPGFIPLDDMKFTSNSAVVVTLAAGGGTCVGMLNVIGKSTE